MQVKMKRKIKTILIFVIVFMVSFFAYKITSKTKEKREIARTIQNIPNFSFVQLDNAIFTKQKLDKNKATVFINFNSECHFCQNEAESIKDNISELKNIQILFISSEPIEVIKNFATNYKLIEHKSIIFLFDKKDVFSDLFDTNMIPTSLIYDKKQQLIKKHNGQIMAKKIIKEINK